MEKREGVRKKENGENEEARKKKIWVGNRRGDGHKNGESLTGVIKTKPEMTMKEGTAVTVRDRRQYLC